METFFLFIIVFIYSITDNNVYIQCKYPNRYKKPNEKGVTTTLLFLSKSEKIKKNFRNGSLTEAKKYINTYTIKNPLKCEVANIIKLTGPNSKNEVFHVEIDHHQQFHYVEGQSCGVIPYFVENEKETEMKEIKEIKKMKEMENQKEDSKRESKEIGIEKEIIKGTKNKTQNNTKKTNHKARLYSISSSNSKKLSVAIKIHKYDVFENERKTEKYGYCSSFIKNLNIKDPIFITGSHGIFVLPEDVMETNKNLIFVGTGTGISPYLSFMKKLFGYKENSKNENQKGTSSTNTTDRIYNGVIHLFYGIRNEHSILYVKELEYFQKKFPDNVHIHYVFSSLKHSDGSSYYVQDKIASVQEQFWNLFFINKSELYICGHKNIKKKIWDILKNCPQFDEHSKKRIHVEVY